MGDTDQIEITPHKVDVEVDVQQVQSITTKMQFNESISAVISYFDDAVAASTCCIRPRESQPKSTESVPSITVFKTVLILTRLCWPRQ